MELTQEHFDKQIESLRTDMATKADLTDALQIQTQELKSYIHESFETQQNYIDERVHELYESMKVKEEVARLKQDVSQIKAALHLT
jgi:gas vesicle protein